MAEDTDTGWTVEVDRETCMGSGLCTVYAADTFDIDDEARSFVKNPRGNDITQIQAAVDACPTKALRMTERKDTQARDHDGATQGDGSAQ